MCGSRQRMSGSPPIAFGNGGGGPRGRAGVRGAGPGRKRNRGMTSYEDVKKAARTARSPTQGRIHFAALLAAAAELGPDDFIVVGGAAIEFHTVGGHHPRENGIGS